MPFPNFDKCDEQLAEYKAMKMKLDTLSLSNGCPMSNRTASLTVGPKGPLLLGDIPLLDDLTHFDRERIPPRVVHAKGTGVHGYFELTHDMSKYTCAKMFCDVGKKTPMFVRFSLVKAEPGHPDVMRDLRGFAMKFYTEEGNWDLVANNTPIFFVRDPIMFSQFIRTQKPHPRTNLRESNPQWDFWSLREESIHQVMWLFGPRGTPAGYRHLNGYGSHTFKMVNAEGKAVYVKFHFKTRQGIKNFNRKQVAEISAKDPDWAQRDLFNSIEEGNYPSWDMYIQVMTFEQAAVYKFNPFDLTKVWQHGDFPLIPVGRMTLNKNVTNYFSETEQVAFSPAHLIPGIDVSPDKMLQARLFSYIDTHYHRVGRNYGQLPINVARECPASNYNYVRDGPMCYITHSKGPNYYPNSFNGPEVTKTGFKDHVYPVAGDVDRHDDSNDDNFTQPRMFWEKALNESERQELCENIADNLIDCYPEIQERALKLFGKVHADFQKGVEVELEKVKKERHARMAGGELIEGNGKY